MRLPLLAALLALTAGCHSLAPYDRGDPRASDGGLDGVADSGSDGDGPRVGTLDVAAPYPTLANWNDYLAVDDRQAGPYGQSGVRCDVSSVKSASDCVHAGQLRQAIIDEKLDCSTLEIVDVRGAFRWDCTNNAAGQTIVRTTGLSRGLAGLIEQYAFAENQLTVSRDGEVLYSSEPAKWGWNNLVQPPPSGYQTSIAELRQSDTVYVVDATTTTDGFNIAADGVALVIADGATLSVNPSIGDNCEYADGSVATDPSGSTSQRAVVCAGGRARLWIEGTIAGDEDNVRSAVLLAGVRMSRLERLRISHAFDNGLLMHDGVGNRLQLVQVQHVATTVQPNATSLRGILLLGEEGLRGRGISVADVRGAGSGSVGAGVYLEDCVDCALSELVSANNDGSGLEIVGGDNVKVASALLTSSDHGVKLYRAQGVTLAHITAALNAEDGVRVELSKGVTVHSLAALSNDDDGIDLRRSSQTKLIDVLLAHHQGLSAVGLYCIECNENEIQGGFWVGDNLVDCAFANPGSNIGFLQSCTASGLDGSNTWSGRSTATLRVNVDCSGCIAGAVTQNSGCPRAPNGSAAYSQLDRAMFCASSVYRVWGALGGDFTGQSARGPCDADGSCRLWDFGGAGAPLFEMRGSTSDGGACPARAVAVMSTVLGSEFLAGAFERLGDGVGDDDGLCERGESCFFAPNLGADQKSSVGAGSCRTGLSAPWPSTLMFSRR